MEICSNPMRSLVIPDCLHLILASFTTSHNCGCLVHFSRSIIFKKNAQVAIMKVFALFTDSIPKCQHDNKLTANLACWMSCKCHSKIRLNFSSLCWIWIDRVLRITQSPPIPTAPHEPLTSLVKIILSWWYFYKLFSINIFFRKSKLLRK